MCACALEWGPHPYRQSPHTICPHIPSSQTCTFGPRAHTQTHTIPSKSAFSAAEQANSAAINIIHTYLHRNKSPLTLPSAQTSKNKHLPNERYTKLTVNNDTRAELWHTVLKHKAPSSTLHTLSEWDKQTYTSHIYQKNPPNCLVGFHTQWPLPSKQNPHEPLNFINISPQSNLLIIAKLNSPGSLHARHRQQELVASCAMFMAG